MTNFVPKGVLPAMVTPFDAKGKVDEEALRRLIEYLIAGGVHGIFAIGTTGEFYALSDAEYRRALRITVDQVKGRLPVYAGANAITTIRAVELARIATDAGVDAISVLTPFFISVSQQQLYDHYSTIAASTNKPIIMYDNCPKTHIHIHPATVAHLADIDNIVGLKDSTGDFTNMEECLRLTKGKNFHMVQGRDTLIHAALCYGATGAVAACANVAPRLCADIYDKYLAGDMQGSLQAQYLIAPLRIAFTLGSFPTVIKEALAMIGVPIGACMLPTGPMSDGERVQLRQILTDMQLL